MLRKIARKIVYGPKSDSDSYIQYLRSQGIKIGENCTIYGPNTCTIDIQYPWMIKIGNNVKITQGVVLLTHDFAWSVLKTFASERVAEKGVILGASGGIEIGDNVFIGINSIICRGVTIGNNVIIGAGSVVVSDCPDNGVYAGNPARFIISVDDYYEKRMRSQLEEANKLAQEYYAQYSRLPEKEVFHEYFMLFASVKDARENRVFNAKMGLCGNYEDSVQYMTKNKASFSCFDDFLAYCFGDEPGGKDRGSRE